jgi:hypothetical protein
MRSLFPDTIISIRISHLVPSLVWAFSMILIFGLSFESFPSMKIAGFLTLSGFAHIFVFCIFTFLLAVGIKKQYNVPVFRNNGEKISLIIGIVYGILLEYLQLIVFSARSFEWFDIMLNIIGAVTGMLIFHMIYRNTL